MTVKAEEETEGIKKKNIEAETVTTTNMKVKKAGVEDKDAPNFHANITTCIVSAHTAVPNTSPKEPGTKTPPPLKRCIEVAH